MAFQSVKNTFHRVNQAIQGNTQADKERDDKARALGFCSHFCRTENGSWENGSCEECYGFGDLEPYGGLNLMDPRFLTRVLGTFVQDSNDGRGPGSIVKLEEDERKNALRLIQKTPLTDQWVKAGYVIQTLPNEKYVVPRNKLNQARNLLLDRSNELQSLRTILQQKEAEVDSLKRLIQRQSNEINKLGHSLASERSSSYARVEDAKRELTEYHTAERDKLKKENEEMKYKILEMGYEKEEITDEAYQRDYDSVKNGLSQFVPAFCHSWYKSSSGEVQCANGACIYNPDLFQRDFERSMDIDFYLQCEAKVFDVVMREVGKHFIVGFEELLLKIKPFTSGTKSGDLDQAMKYMMKLFTSLEKPDRLTPPFTENDRAAFNAWRASLFRAFVTIHQTKTSRKDRGKESPVSDSLNEVVSQVIANLGDIVCYGKAKSKNTVPPSLLKSIKAIIAFTTRIGSSKAEFLFETDMLGYPFNPDAMSPVPQLSMKKLESAKVKRVLFPALTKRGDDSGSGYDKVLILTKALVFVEIDSKRERGSSGLGGTIHEPFEQPHMELASSDKAHLPHNLSSKIEGGGRVGITKEGFEIIGIDEHDGGQGEGVRDDMTPRVGNDGAGKGDGQGEIQTQQAPPLPPPPPSSFEPARRLPRSPTSSIGIDLQNKNQA